MNVIHLHPHEQECHLCQATIYTTPEGGGQGIPIYEDRILADDEPGDWGGVPCCRPCFALVRELQDQGKKQGVTTTEVRAERERRIREAGIVLGRVTVLSSVQAMNGLVNLWQVGLTIQEAIPLLEAYAAAGMSGDVAAYVKEVMQREARKGEPNNGPDA